MGLNITNKVKCEGCQEYFIKGNPRGFFELNEHNYKGFVRKIYFCEKTCLYSWKYGDTKK